MVKYNDDNIGRTFHALSDETRRALVTRLSKKSPLSMLELAEPFTISLPAISKHVKILEQAQLVTREQKGRVHLISFNPKPMAEATGWLERYQKFWDIKLDSLEKYLDKHK